MCEQKALNTFRQFERQESCSRVSRAALRWAHETQAHGVAAAGWGGVVACSVASVEYPWLMRSAELKHHRAPVRAVSDGASFSRMGSTACGYATYNYALERTKLWATRSALNPLAAQLDR